MLNLTGKILEFEAGELSEEDTLELFSELVRTGRAWTLQGSYGRAAASLIENGYLSPNGEILKQADE